MSRPKAKERVRLDGAQVATLVQTIERLANGENMTVGEIAMTVFGWDVDRTFAAIDSAVHDGLIAPGPRVQP